MSRSCLPNFEAAIISCPRCWSASTHPAATVAAGLNARTAPVGEHRRRAPAQRTAEKHGEDGAVAQPLACCDVRRVREPLHLPVGGSVAGPDADSTSRSSRARSRRPVPAPAARRPSSPPTRADGDARRAEGDRSPIHARRARGLRLRPRPELPREAGEALSKTPRLGSISVVNTRW